MFITLDFEYYKIEVNDESKETKCTRIINPWKKNIDWIFETNIEFFGHILKLKRITKFNMIMIVNYFYLNSYRL